jgi:uroporphyrinogen-III synthase
VRVLIVRPAPGNKATAKAVAALGLEPVVVPLFEIVPLAWVVPDPAQFDAVVMTSANAARHGGPGLARFVHLPLFAVGEATGKAARASGFVEIRVGAGDVGALGPDLSGHVLHIAGVDYQPIVTPAKVTVVRVYNARPVVAKTPLDAEIALIHSARAGACLAEGVADRTGMQIVAISPGAARACGSGWAAVHTADGPREQAMLECLARLCEARLRNGLGRT